MLEQWEATRLLAMPKIYTYDTAVDLSRGADNDYQIETNDGTEFFLLDVRGPGRNPNKACFQLRYRRIIVLARMCLVGRHTNPDDDTSFDGPHFHIYSDEYGVKIAEPCGPFDSLTGALSAFCRRINLPVPNVDGGMP